MAEQKADQLIKQIGTLALDEILKVREELEKRLAKLALSKLTPEFLDSVDGSKELSNAQSLQQKMPFLMRKL